MSLKKFTPGGTEEQILPNMSIPYTVYLKQPYSNAKVQFEHVLYVPLARQLIYEELKIFFIPELISAYIFWRRDLLYINRYGQTVL